MRVSTGWWLVAGLAMVLASGAAGIGRREPVCETTADPPRALDLQKADDRAHLERDLDRVATAASVFGAAVSRRPTLSDSIDARAGAATAPARARVWCKATLEAQLATAHELTIDQVRAFGETDAEGRVVQAEAERTSGTSAMSSVVSRPSR